MRKEIAKKWIKELRSGNYKQITGMLKSNEEDPSFCCLGVLCEIAVQEGVIKPATGVKGLPMMRYEGIPFNVPDVLPEAVRDWAGMSSDTGSFVTEDNHFESLACLNDKGESFNKIAKIIEEYVEKL